jgi:hypothetical protein
MAALRAYTNSGRSQRGYVVLWWTVLLLEGSFAAVTLKLTHYQLPPRGVSGELRSLMDTINLVVRGRPHPCGLQYREERLRRARRPVLTATLLNQETADLVDPCCLAGNHAGSDALRAIRKRASAASEWPIHAARKGQPKAAAREKGSARRLRLPPTCIKE